MNNFKLKFCGLCCFLALTIYSYPANAQAQSISPLSAGVMVDSTGVVSSPANFWSANAASLSAGMPPLVPTAVKTSGYTAAAQDFIPVDATSASVTVTLPTAPADKTRVAIQMIATAGGHTVTFSAAGSDVFNKAGGVTSGTLTLANQAVTLQYAHATAIWYVASDANPLAQLDLRYPLLSSGLVPLANLGSGAMATTLLHGNNVFSAVSLSADVTGTLSGSSVSGGTFGPVNGSALTSLTSANLTGALPAISGASLTGLNASQLTSGTVPNGAFPATLPAASGVNLTAMNATQLTSGTVPDARFPATLPAASGANLTSLAAGNISSGTLNNARLSGVALTANNLSDVTASTARANLAVPGLAVDNALTGNQVFTGGVNAIGSPENMTASSITGGAGGGALRIYTMGNPAYQDSGESTYDSQVIFYNMNPFTSGSGIQMPLIGYDTDAAAYPGTSVLGVNNLGKNILLMNKAASSFVTVPLECIISDLPGTALWVGDNQVMAIASDNLRGGGGVTIANRSFIWMDPHSYTTRFPLSDDTRYYPTDNYFDSTHKMFNSDGCPSVLVIDQKLNAIAVGASTAVTLGTGSSIVGAATPTTLLSTYFYATGAGTGNAGLTFHGNGASGQAAIGYQITNPHGVGDLWFQPDTAGAVMSLMAGNGGSTSGYIAGGAMLVGGSDASVTNTDYETATISDLGSFSVAVTAAQTSSYSILATDHTVILNGTTITGTLPTASDHCKGRIYLIKNIHSGAATVATTSSQTIDGSTTYSLSAQYKYVMVQSDGANWQIVGNN